MRFVAQVDIQIHAGIRTRLQAKSAVVIGNDIELSVPIDQRRHVRPESVSHNVCSVPVG